MKVSLTASEFNLAVDNEDGLGIMDVSVTDFEIKIDVTALIRSGTELAQAVDYCREQFAAAYYTAKAAQIHEADEAQSRG